MGPPGQKKAGKRDITRALTVVRATCLPLCVCVFACACSSCDTFLRLHARFLHPTTGTQWGHTHKGTSHAKRERQWGQIIRPSTLVLARNRRAGGEGSKREVSKRDKIISLPPPICIRNAEF